MSPGREHVAESHNLTPSVFDSYRYNGARAKTRRNWFLKISVQQPYAVSQKLTATMPPPGLRYSSEPNFVQVCANLRTLLSRFMEQDEVEAIIVSYLEACHAVTVAKVIQAQRAECDSVQISISKAIMRSVLRDSMADENQGEPEKQLCHKALRILRVGRGLWTFEP